MPADFRLDKEKARVIIVGAGCGRNVNHSSRLGSSLSSYSYRVGGLATAILLKRKLNFDNFLVR